MVKVGTPVKAARCPGPESLPMKALALSSRAKRQLGNGLGSCDRQLLSRLQPPIPLVDVAGNLHGIMFCTEARG